MLFALGLACTAGAFARWPLRFLSASTQLRLVASGIHEHSVSVDGLTVRTLDGGTGKPVVFVHGLGGQAQDWTALLLEVKRAGFHVYAVDLPGFGGSAKPAELTYSIREQSHFVESFLDSVQLAHISLVGISMGGWIAATVALDAPQRVERLVLVDSAGFAFKPSFDTGLFTPTTPEQVDGLLALLLPHPDPIPRFVKEDVVRESERAPGW